MSGEYAEYATPFERAEAAAETARAAQAKYGHLLSPEGRVAAAWGEATYEMLTALVETVERMSTATASAPDANILNEALHGLVERYERRSASGGDDQGDATPNTPG